MTQGKKDGSLEALVAADKAGCSGPPGGAQAPVADDTCDLRARDEQIRALKADRRSVRKFLRTLQRRYEASKTHVGGNVPVSHSEVASGTNERKP